jgi:hypothetical protein
MKKRQNAFVFVYNSKSKVEGKIEQNSFVFNVLTQYRSLSMQKNIKSKKNQIKLEANLKQNDNFRAATLTCQLPIICGPAREINFKVSDFL